MNNGDNPAMPFEGGQNSGMQPHTGLTKREELAGRAMQSLIPVYAEMTEEYSTPQEWIKCHMETACDMADALLAELEKPKGLTELEKELLEALELADEYRGMVPAEVSEKISKAIAKAKGQL